jgi:hypothetical protein
MPGAVIPSSFVTKITGSFFSSIPKTFMGCCKGVCNLVGNKVLFVNLKKLVFCG